MPKKYKLKRIDDLLKIPRDRRKICLEELAEGLERIEDEKEKITRTVPSWLRWLFFLQLRSIVWIDDGKRNLTMRVKI